MTSTELRVVTLNIRYPSKSDEGNLWVDRRSIVAELLERLDADIVCMQEAHRTQLHDVLTDTPRYATIGRERRGKTDEEHMPILLRANRFMVEMSGIFWLSDTPDVPGSRQWMPEDHPRVVTWARAIDLGTAQRFLIANTHFPLGDEILRSKSAQLIMERIGSDELPTILCGDFNAEPNTAPHRIFTGDKLESTSEYFVDAWEATTNRVGPTATFHGFSGTPKRDTYRIDWILYRNGVRATRVETVAFERNGKYPADHFPVCADLVIESADTEGR